MLSPVDPITKAIDRVREALFQPFDFMKWVALGFCAFLAGLVDGRGGGFGGAGNFGGGGGKSNPQMQDFQRQATAKFGEVSQWAQENILLILVVALLLCCLSLVVMLLMHWLSARGRFMFLDNVVHNRAEVKAPWAEFRELAWSFFWYRFLFGQIVGGILFLFVGIAAIPVLLALMSEGPVGASIFLSIMLGTVLVIPTALFWGVAVTLLQDFIVPIMYLRRVRTREAIGIFRAALMSEHVGGLVVYVIVRWVLGMVTGFFAVFMILCTCCVGVIPVVGSIILLPLTYFMRCYALYYLEQYGPVWQVFPPKPDMQIPENPVLMV